MNVERSLFLWVMACMTMALGCATNDEPANGNPGQDTVSTADTATLAKAETPWEMRDPPHLYDIAMLFAWSKDWAGTMPSWGFNEPALYAPVKWNKGHDDTNADMFTARRGKVGVVVNGTPVEANVRITGPKVGYFSFALYSGNNLTSDEARAWLDDYLNELGPERRTLLDSCSSGTYTGWRYDVTMPDKKPIWLKSMILGAGNKRTAKLYFHLYKADLGEACNDHVPHLDPFGRKRRRAK